MKIVVIGCGKIGKTIVEQVSKEGHDITIIDNDKDMVETVIEKYDSLGVVGNGASLGIQQEAEVQNADLVIAATPEDETNILACMVAKHLGAKSTIARVRKPEYAKQIVEMRESLGLSMSVNPELETAEEIENIIALPSLLKMEKFSRGKVVVAEILIADHNPLIGESLISMSKKITAKILVGAVQRGQEVIIPNGNFVIQKGDHINVITDAKMLRKFLREINLIKSPLKDIMILGGGRIGYYLARDLSENKYNVKLIEFDEERALNLAETLPKVTVVHGDGTDHDLLMEEGIEHADACISLTNIDEENIIASIFANKMKVKKVVAKVKRSSLVNLVDDLDIASIVSPKDLVANRIITYIRAKANSRGSNIQTLYRLVGNKVEALEFLAKKEEHFFDKPFKDLKIKKNCLIAAIIRNGQVIIPGGNDYITLNDSVLVVTTHEMFDDLTDAFE